MARDDVIDRDLGMKDFIAGLHALEDLTLDVGIFDNPELVKRAIINELGAPSVNIAARPAWQTFFDTNRAHIFNLFEEAAERVAMNKSTPKRELNKLGVIIAKGLKKQIHAWTSPPNRAATIGGAGASGKGRNDPLVDTAETVNAITHRVRKAKG